MLHETPAFELVSNLFIEGMSIRPVITACDFDAKTTLRPCKLLCRSHQSHSNALLTVTGSNHQTGDAAQIASHVEEQYAVEG